MFIGLTGSFGSGKSTVAQIFKELGVEIIDADEIAKEVVLPGKSAYCEIIEIFGKEVINPDRSLNRKKIAEMVFSNEDLLNKLNSIVHPKVRERELELRDELKDKPLVVFVVPLLFEKGFEKYVDRVVAVVVDNKIRIDRLTKNQKFSPQEIQERLNTQLSQEEKIRRSDFVIDNSGSIENTRLQVVHFVNQLLNKNKNEKE